MAPILEPRATIDFETRSLCNIQRAGSWIYAKHPSTMVLCLAWKLPGQKESSLWHAGYGDVPPGEYGETTLQDLFDWIRKGGLVEAHNAFFERVIWHHIATRPLEFVRDEKDGNAYIGARGMGAPPIADNQWRCSAAKAAAMAFPRGLGDACDAVGVAVRKDSEGRKVMLKLTKPRPKRKADNGHSFFYHDAPLHEHLHSYCRTDVDAEHALSEELPDLSPFELKVWQADQRANWRGVAVDMELVDAAIALDQKVKEKLNAELFELTGIDAGTKRTAVLEWLQFEHMVQITDTSAPTLDWVMERPWYKELDPAAQRVIKIARDINRTSVSKYHRIKEMADPDDHRVRDLVRYHGAATGRWAGSGIQVQNFPRGNLPDYVTFEQAIADVKSGDLEWCEYVYGDVLNLLSSCSRGALISPAGRTFYVADYSAIEARIVLWLAGAQKALDVFRRGEDIYCDMASGIFGRKITKADKYERQLGKLVILGLGYGMGPVTFLLNLRGYGMKFTKQEVNAIIGASRVGRYKEWVRKLLAPTPEMFIKVIEPKGGGEPFTRMDDTAFKVARQQQKKTIRRLVSMREDPVEVAHELALCKYLVDVYRARYPEVVKLWKRYEEATVMAVLEPGKRVEVGPVTWVVEDRFLKCYLPSGRCLHYADPHIKEVETPWGAMRPEVRYWGVHKKTKRWSKMGSYGGAWTENVDQATARDIMAIAFVAVDEVPVYEPITTIHDELLAEADEGTGSVQEFEGLLTDLPAYFDGCPIAAEGATFNRYRK